MGVERTGRGSNSGEQGHAGGFLMVAEVYGHLELRHVQYLGTQIIISGPVYPGPMTKAQGTHARRRPLSSPAYTMELLLCNKTCR